MRSHRRIGGFISYTTVDKFYKNMNFSNNRQRREAQVIKQKCRSFKKSKSQYHRRLSLDLAALVLLSIFLVSSSFAGALHIPFLVQSAVSSTRQCLSIAAKEMDSKTFDITMTDMEEREKALVPIASSWCASHGVLMGSKNKKPGAHDYVFEPAPFSLHPSPFPKSGFDKATSLGIHFNHMVHSIAEQYEEWLRPTVKVAAASDKDFTGRLVMLADEVYSKVKQGKRAQNVVLGLFRSDYMLNKAANPLDDPYPLQVELNTIASSFGCLSTKLSRMHRHLSFLPISTYTSKELPENNAALNIASGLASAFQEFKNQRPDAINPAVVMVVQPGESNSCDQRDLEFLLQEQHGVRLIRRTLKDFATISVLNDAEELMLPDDHGGTMQVTAAVVYFRAGYTPNDYPSETEWLGRSLIEHSVAIKSPDIFYHLVGTKKVQQALATPGTLRQFVTSDEVHDLLFSSFADLYPLGEGDDYDIVQMALDNPQNFVLKPQREGGGNNLYDNELVKALNSLSYDERGAYILMQKIRPPASFGSLVRGGEIVYRGDTVCELGMFGVSVREYKTGRVIQDVSGGHILRSKSVQTDEGGVAAGYAFLSSPRLT